MKNLLDKKRGQMGLHLAKNTFILFLVLVVIGVVALVTVYSLLNANIFAAGSVGANQTAGIINNYSNGISTFFGSTGTIFTILIVVIIISLLAIVLYVVQAFGGGRGSATGL